MTNIVPDYFGAFYSTPAHDDDGLPILWGAARQHSEQRNAPVSYVRLAFEIPSQLNTDDQAGEFIADMTVWSADGQKNMLAFVATGDVSSFHPVTQAMIAQDLAHGLTREEIVDKRALIMSPEFLGFCPQHVFMVRPELAGSDEIEVDGETVSVPRWRPGGWWALDNPEFVGE